MRCSLKRARQSACPRAIVPQPKGLGKGADLGSSSVPGDKSEIGATCFFHINMAFPNDAQYPGSEDPGYDDYWQTAQQVAADNCQGCHQADPWLHSPWIDQLRDPRSAARERRVR